MIRGETEVGVVPPDTLPPTPQNVTCWPIPCPLVMRSLCAGDALDPPSEKFLTVLAKIRLIARCREGERSLRRKRGVRG